MECKYAHRRQMIPMLIKKLVNQVDDFTNCQTSSLTSTYPRSLLPGGFPEDPMFCDHDSGCFNHGMATQFRWIYSIDSTCCRSSFRSYKIE